MVGGLVGIFGVDGGLAGILGMAGGLEGTNGGLVGCIGGLVGGLVGRLDGFSVEIEGRVERPRGGIEGSVGGSTGEIGGRVWGSTGEIGGRVTLSRFELVGTTQALVEHWDRSAAAVVSGNSSKWSDWAPYNSWIRHSDWQIKLNPDAVRVLAEVAPNAPCLLATSVLNRLTSELNRRCSCGVNRCRG